MKKVLFATTALVATAGVAAADVTFGGYGRFGILYNSALTAPGQNKTNITSRFRLQIDATAESDAGVTVGARARIQQNNTDDGQPAIIGNQGPAGTGINGVRFFARSGGLEIGVGNIFGAIDSIPQLYPIDLGLTGLGYNYTVTSTGGADAYSSGGNGAAGSNGVEIIYSMGDFTGRLSASDTNDRIAGSVTYNTNGWSFSLGVQDSDNAADTEWVLGASGSFGVADVTVAWADNGTAGDQWVLAGRFDVGAATNVEAYVADADAFATTSYGVDFNHDLGGGVSLRGGVAKLGNDTTRADFGVRFNF